MTVYRRRRHGRWAEYLDSIRTVVDEDGDRYVYFGTRRRLLILQETLASMVVTTMRQLQDPTSTARQLRYAERRWEFLERIMTPDEREEAKRVLVEVDLIYTPRGDVPAA